MVQGSTRRQHLEAAGYTEETMIDGDLPPILYDLFEHFLNLHTTRKSNGFGMMAIDYEGMDAYFRLIQYCPEVWEIDVIRRLDNLALQAHSEKK